MAQRARYSAGSWDQRHKLDTVCVLYDVGLVELLVLSEPESVVELRRWGGAGACEYDVDLLRVEIPENYMKEETYRGYYVTYGPGELTVDISDWSQRWTRRLYVENDTAENVAKSYIDFLHDQDETDRQWQANQDNYEEESAASLREYQDESYGGTSDE